MSLALLLALMLALALALMFACISPAELAELRKKREAAGAVVIKLRDESFAEGFVETPEWSAKWDKANEDYNAALAAEESATEAETKREARRVQAERIERDAARLGAVQLSRLRPDYNPASDSRARGGIPAFPAASEWHEALTTWAMCLSPSFDPTEEQLNAVKRCRINLRSNEVYLPAGRGVMAMVEEFQNVFLETHPNRRALAIRQALASWNTMTPESAGYVAQPPTVLQQVEVNRLAWGGLLQVATVKQTTTGEDILLPFTDDTTVSGRRITEDGPLGTENNPRFGQIRWGAYKYTSDVIAVTYEMLRDSFFDLETHIGTIGGERLGRIENREATLGTGNSMPRGAVFAAPVGKTAASATAIVYDELIDLEASVDDAYMNGERVGWMMNKGILTHIRKLKDLNGLPILTLAQENTTNRDMLFGRPVYINRDMANAPVASADVILFGDFSKIVVRRVGGTRVVRDPYTQRISNDRDLFAVVEYMDSNVVNAGTAPIKKLRMAA